jgi:adenylate kinase
MAMAGRRLGLVDSYKDLPKLKLADRVRLQEEVASEVAESSGPVVIVAHVVVRAPEGYVDGLPPTVLDKLRLTGMLVVTSTSEQVRARREGPMIESAGVISSHQDRVRIASTKIAEELAIPAAFILNLYGAFDGALERAFLFWEMFDSGARIGLRSMERL